MKRIRDLFEGEPIKNPTLRELAADVQPHIVYEQSDGEGLISSMPRDLEEHPAHKVLTDHFEERRAKGELV